ncbi:carboxylesterase family protein [Novosphingobium decolorationis]|uniref:Carboxylesterase family protein n=1 Tax=Novosphingobium decolorationis TaxID=2698673 RepID=A0ABX8E7D3_9SPHN|nr:carboxylesterase family protein [Novosphingobium decolorationis]MED5543966.1 carboxylesterase family protein [Pseudomonadota bacterium]QVM84125.1 carboxylesterase family protein [Novosphingobium decolorationis]
MIDGYSLPEQSEEAFAAGREAQVPFITGSNSWEASLMRESIAQDPERALASLGPLQSRVEAAYAGSGDRLAMAQVVRTDVTSTEPVRHLARLHAANGQPSYAYFFDYVPRALRAQFPGAGHGSEIPFVFDNLTDEGFTFYGAPQPPATAQDHAIAKAAIGYWVNFARDGSPGAVDGLEWKPITPEDAFLTFRDEGPEMQLHFRSDKLDLLEAVPAQTRSPIG